MSKLQAHREEIKVLSRLKAEDYSPAHNGVCVSITNPRQSPARLTGWQEVLRLGFHDTHRPGGGFTAMSFQHACDLLEFCRKHRDVPLMVHCEAGASRSVAAGIFVAAWLKRPLQLTEVDVLNPNPWVILQLRLAALYLGLKRLDRQLLKISLIGPMPFRFNVLPRSIAETYFD